MLRTPTVFGLLGLSLFSCHPLAAPEPLPAKPSAPATPTEEYHPAAPSGNKGGTRRNTAHPSLTEILAGAESSILVHTVDPRAHNVLNGWHGTAVTLPPNSLVLADGSEPAGPVTITLQEYYTPAEMIGGRITTTSFGRLLETAGAVLVVARAVGQACTLRPGTLMDIEFPYDQKLPGMQLFAGTREDGALNWNAIYDLKSGNRFFRSGSEPAAHRAGIGYYSFHCPELGLISCSRFTEEGAEKWNLEINDGARDEGSLHVLFQSTNSLLEGKRSVRGIRIEDLPAGEPVLVLMTRQSAGRIYFSVKWGITGDPALQEPAFVSVSPQELQQKLRALSRKKDAPEKPLALSLPFSQTRPYL
jgi:hypothetical protein